jgi:phenylacetate-coenzyme A ligase PaaK-like adenylate-forming protein
MRARIDPDRTLIEPIELASRDEIAALQTQRLAATLQHVYANVPAYRRKFVDAGVHPDDFRRLEDLAKFPFSTKADLREKLSLRALRRAARKGRAHSCLIPARPQADRRRLYAERH